MKATIDSLKLELKLMLFYFIDLAGFEMHYALRSLGLNRRRNHCSWRRQTLISSIFFARPLVVECESAEQLSEIYNRIVGDRQLNQVIEHVDIYGPFGNIPENIVLVDTPGLGDSALQVSERTHRYFGQLDDVWMLTELDRPLSLAIETNPLRTSFFNRCNICVFVSKCDELQEGEKDEIMKIIERNLTKKLNPKPRSTDHDDESLREQRSAMISQIVDNVSFWRRRRNLTPGPVWASRLESIGREEAERLDDCVGELMDIETRSFIDMEPSLFEEEVAQALRVSLEDCFNNIGPFSATDLGSRIHRRCDSIWPKNGNTIYSLMRSARRGVSHDHNLARDIAETWASLVQAGGMQCLQDVSRKLREAYNEHKATMGEEARRRARRKLRQIEDEIHHIASTVFSARVKRFVQSHMENNGFFPHFNWDDRKADGRNYLPTKKEITRITRELLNELRGAVANLRQNVLTSSLLTSATHQTLPHALDYQWQNMLNAVVDGPHIEEDICTITHEPLIGNDPVKIVPCGHTFSREGILNAVAANHRRCPLCRGAIDMDDSHWRVAPCHHIVPRESVAEGGQTCPVCENPIRGRSVVPLLTANYVMLWRHDEQLARNHVRPPRGWWNDIWREMYNQMMERAQEEDLRGAEETKE